MKLTVLSPVKSISKGFLKRRALKSDFDLFRKNLAKLFSSVSEMAREENQKNHLRDFLRETYYKNTNEVNTKDNKDLVIHLGKTAQSKVGVIIEAKRPGNKSEMISEARPNSKALHELVLYYLRERIEENNLDLKYLVATNIYEWFIFDASDFENLFFKNKKFVKDYEDWRDGKKVSKDTGLFYSQIAAAFIESLNEELPCTYFNLGDYEKILESKNQVDIKKLIALQKLLSPNFLLKIPFAEDSNSLNEGFYRELLHIVGLEEIRDGSKPIIQRVSENRQPGTLIENTISILKTEDILRKLKNKTDFGKTKDEQLFGIALELSLTWINRILFLKLLEGQLLGYHNGNHDYRFLNTQTIPDFDELYKMFHQVLVVMPNERAATLKEKYSSVPYLNSSLFEISELEQETLKVNSLDNSQEIELLTTTILKEEKIKSDRQMTLTYLFSFLNAYDFSGDSGEDITEDNKILINASVLGKVFEKINGYKDGSIFTPGFITMYMSRESLRMTVIRKFNDHFRQHQILEVQTFDELYNRIEKIGIEPANKIMNSLRVCDPAVGSGHFLVSVLNELIAIKSELGILTDENGKRLRDYEIAVDNDELVITDDHGVFKYNFRSRESRRVQETIFNQRKTIIENCLFGVDINPNSAKICRLRLWIELLKSTYYKAPDFTELETLPNIDINIKTGNSLISRFALDADLRKALKKSKWDIGSYRLAVSTYRNARNKEEKYEMQRLIEDIKSNFETEIQLSDKRFRKLHILKGELFTLTNQVVLFDKTDEESNAWNERITEVATSIKEQENLIDEIRNSEAYRNAFEWRFEFPEVLNDEGDFEGFDLIIGNPPYFSVSTHPHLKVIDYKYETYIQTGDIYMLFYELGLRLARDKYYQCLVVSNKWMRTNYGKVLRQFILEKSNPLLLVDFGQNLVFDHAVVHASIILSQKEENQHCIEAFRFKDKSVVPTLKAVIATITGNTIKGLAFDENVWNIIKPDVQKLKIKIEIGNKRLADWPNKLNFGLKTGLNRAFIITADKKDEILRNEPQSRKLIKPILRGRDTRKYFAEFKDLWIINIPKGYTIKTRIGLPDAVAEPMPHYGYVEYNEAWEWFKNRHPALAAYLKPFEKDAEKRDDQGDYWWELRACAYLQEFEKPKIIFSEIVSEPQFYYDDKGFYPEATVFFISGEHLKYLTAILNSKAATFFFKTFYMGGELVGKIRYKKAFLLQLPIPVPTENEENEIGNLVDKIMEMKRENMNPDAIEKQIESWIYSLYQLTPDEIKTIEDEINL
jgi:adenine-specific DNA-methyltransferase